MAKDPRFNPEFQKNQIADSVATKTSITDGSIIGSKLAVDSVTADKLAANSVNTVNVVNNAVTAAKIADGQITDAKMTTGVQQRLANGFIKKQIVNRRPLIISETRGYSVYSMSAYGPFSYNVPSVQSGAERRFRLYAVYSDNDTTSSIIVSFTPFGDATYYGYYGGYPGPSYGYYNFYLPLTWGDALTYRDAYSNEIVGNLDGRHMSIRYGTSHGDTTLRVLYLEIQTLDVFP